MDKTSARRMAFVKCILVTITTVLSDLMVKVLRTLFTLLGKKKLVISYGDQLYNYICILISDLVTNQLSEAL